MAKLQAPSGFRDFLPDAYRKRSELIRRIRAVYESFGFEGIETPALENLSVFLGKGGGENEKLMFRVLKRGAELQRALEKSDELADLALRFDLTVPLARYYATHRGELPAVFKRYHIGPVWRAERAQHGRFREFMQCDVDVLGSPSMLVEAEVIQVTTTALAELGFKNLTVRLNSRPLLRLLVTGAGVPVDLVAGVFTSLDKLDKVPPEEVKKEMLERGVPETAATRLLRLRDTCGRLGTLARIWLIHKEFGGDTLPHLEQLNQIVSLVPGAGKAVVINDASQPVGSVAELLEMASLGLEAELAAGSGKHIRPEAPVTGAAFSVIFDPFLARGMDYYTGPIFEVAAEGVPLALAGGGRYDELIGLLCGQKVPACGFSIGFERVFEVMEERKMFAGLPPLKWADHWKAFQAADVFVAMAPTKSREDLFELSKESIDLAGKLRGAGLRADLFVGTQKLGSQYELAEGKGIRWAVFLDPQAPHHPQVNLRDLRTRTTEPVLRQAVAALLVERTRNDPPPQSSRADGRP